MYKQKIRLIAVILGILPVWVFGQITEAQRRADTKFQTALTAFDQQIFANAREGFEQALATQSLSPERTVEAYYYRAISALELFHADAENLMQAFIETYPTSSLVNQARRYLGQFFFRNRNYRKSEKYLSEVDLRNIDREDRPEIRFQLGYSYFINDNIDQAKDIFVLLKEQSGPFAASARYYYAHIVYEEENYSEALINFEALRNDQAFARMVPFYLAHVYYQMREYDSLFVYALEILADDQAPRRAEIAKLVGDAHYRLEHFEKAVEYFELYREEGGKPSRNDHYELGFSYYKIKNYEKAIEHFSRVSMGQDELAQVTYYHLGDCHLQKEDKQSALTAFAAASKINADAAIQEDASFQFVKLNYELGGVFADVVSSLTQFQRNFPKSDNLRKINTLLADAHLRSRNYARAAQALKDAGLRTIEQQGIFQKVSYFLGVEAYQQERYTTAVAHFAESRKYPIDQAYVALALYWAAESFYQLMEYDAAIGAYLEFQANPGAYQSTYFSYSYYGLGYAYYMAGKLEEAATTFRRFSREKGASGGRFRDGLLRLADVYFLLRSYPQALEFYDKSIKESDGKNTYSIFQKAICQGLIGEERQKIATLDGLIKNFPSDPLALDARFEKASSYIKLEAYEDAIRIYQAFNLEHPNHPNAPRAKLNMSLAYRNTQRYDQAIKLLKEIVESYPNTPESSEAIRFGQNVFSEADRMGEYVLWVQSSGAKDVEQGRLDSALYFSAFDQYSVGNHQAAIRGFRDYADRFPNGLFRMQTIFYIADSHFRLKEDDKALEYFEEVLTTPRSPFYDRALERAAQLRYLTKDYPQAGNYYRQILDRNPMEETRMLATERLMRIAFIQQDWPKLEDWSQRVLTTNPEQAKLRRDARWYRALSLYHQHRRPEADSALAIIANTYQGNEAAQAMYYLGEFFWEDRLLEETKKQVYALIEKHPGEVELRDRALILLARAFTEEEDFFQAEFSLDFVIQSNSNENVTKEAQDLLNALKQREQEAQKKSENEAWEVNPSGENHLPNESDEE
jgi:TolA-binding protein